MEYKIVGWFWDAKEGNSGNNYPVPALLKDGWRPQGGVSVETKKRELLGEATFYTQAFVREPRPRELRRIWAWLFYKT